MQTIKSSNVNCSMDFAFVYASEISETAKAHNGTSEFDIDVKQSQKSVPLGLNYAF